MGKSRILASALIGAAAALLLYNYSRPATAADAAGPEYLHWPATAGNAKYGTIDGKQIWRLVVEQAEIARRYRDNGHPQFWGRLAGTTADTEDVQWLLNKYRQIGLSDMRVQTVNYFAPQWSAQSWEVAATAGDKSLQIPS